MTPSEAERFYLHAWTVCLIENLALDYGYDQSGDPTLEGDRQEAGGSPPIISCR